MSNLADRAPARAAELPPSPIAAPAQAAVRAAAGGLVPVAVPVVVAWVLGAGGEATWAQAVRLALALWLLAQHTGLAVDGGHVGLVPLGLAAVPFVATWFAGRRLARTMDPRGDRIAAGASRATPAMLHWRHLLTFVAAYGLVAALASFAAGMPGLRPVSAQAVLGAGVTAALGGGLGAATYRFGGLRAAVRAVLRRLPSPVPAYLRPAAVAQVTQLGAAALVVVVLLVTQVSGVTALHRALDPGVSGSAVLTLGQVMLLPNLVLWACAVLAGPGFAVGTGTSVTVTGSHLGPLPAIPVLAALPAPGSLPGPMVALLAVPVLSGVLAGIVVVRRTRTPGVVARLGEALGASLGCGLSAGLLAWLSGGPAGPGRLAEVGPRPLLVAVAVAGEVALGAVLTVLVTATPAGQDGVREWTLRLARRAGAAGPADGGRAGGDTAPGPRG
jgi:Family of unknown function (DUF6350)